MFVKLVKKCFRSRATPPDTHTQKKREDWSTMALNARLLLGSTGGLSDSDLSNCTLRLLYTLSHRAAVLGGN